MPALKDYYKALGLAESASADEIKKAYRKLARESHPDRHPDDKTASERFKEISEAYEILSDDSKRAQYDRARKHPFGSAFGDAFSTSAGNRFRRSSDGTYVRFDQGADSFGGPGADGGIGGLGDLFGRFFGMEPEQAQTSRPPSQEIEVRISFSDSLAGGKVEVKVPGGRSVRVPFPKGVRNGYRVRLKNRPAGVSSGELFVRFGVDDHPVFKRDGKDLIARIEVNVFEALLGATRSLDSPYGQKLKITIPKGAQPGERMRLRGQGVRTDKEAGDLLVEIEVVIPKNLTRFEEDEIRKAAERVGLI